MTRRQCATPRTANWRETKAPRPRNPRNNRGSETSAAKPAARTGRVTPGRNAPPDGRGTGEMNRGNGGVRGCVRSARGWFWRRRTRGESRRARSSRRLRGGCARPPRGKSPDRPPRLPARANLRTAARRSALRVSSAPLRAG